ncbi:DUF6017 domain-containing protein [uncultured Acetatifactor sp.]|uniref:DUF6017 domain-containing protein n=1 Tax=uncultured Acetatifactor sp. TaxID=1671927 RepID=UPI00262939F6|nr:DUF6017 domain-containing protein [uncultured Acetatifactor sp.]
MGEPLKFDYYYGIEAEQFSFYRVPRLLIKDERFKGLSSDAKLLYGLMLDRMSMSMKNGWLDDENRAYIIYAVENIMEDLGCSKPTCIKVIKELDADNGIGLIEKKRRGLGKPDIIYVKNFASVPEKECAEKPENTDVSTEVKNLYFKKERNLTSGSKETELQQVKESDFKRENNLTSGSKETGLQEVKEFAPNYNNTNYNNQNYTDMSYTNPINQSTGNADAIDETSAYMALIRKNLEYEHHMRYDQDRDMYEEIYETVCDVVCVKRRTIRINGEEYPYELVKSRFLKLNSGHVEYVMSCMRETVTKITNIRAYLITALYNAPSTMSHYYQQEVQHDMYGGGWAEKGIT